VRNVVRRIAVLAAGALAACAVFEVGLRPLYWLPYVHHPRLGSILPAGTVARYCREGCGTSRWADDGARHATPLDPARPAILAVGDSFTEALMTDDALVYPQRLEAGLDGGWQVVNVGRSGASPADYIALAPLYAERYAPRWTVIQLRADDLERDACDPSKTHFARRAEGGVEAVEVPPRPSRTSQLLAPLRRRFALVNLATLRLREFRAAASTEPPLFRATARAPAEGTPAASYPIEAELEALAAAYGGRVTFLFLPDFDPHDVATPGATELRFTGACLAHAWSCVDLRSAFPQLAARRESPYGFPNSTFNTGHMNDAGHAAAAALLHEEIARLRTLALL